MSEVKYLDYEGLQELKNLMDNTYQAAVEGKGLSTEDFTTDLKNKLDNIASGATANTGTVTAISVDGADYTPVNGVVSLPNYPTTLPASDVNDWAKAQTKPSYSASEIGLDKVGNFKAVSTEASLGLTSTELANARTNIGAGTSSLELGDTSSTAYRGDLGKIAYEHSLSNHARTDATKTEASEVNGNIKINGTETNVYTHPGSGTNPHGTTKNDVGLGNVGNFKAVSTDASQGLTSTEQANARANIGAGTSSFSGSYNDLTNKPDLSGMIETTYSNLVSLRNNSQLIPSKWYRITDYQCTTVKENTQSANHPFDIIVRADSVNVLNENAYAAKHAGDTYFANSKLEAWELKYILDNDTTKFNWADSTNGKGVIYWMKDEFNNECPYDFKNIQFKRWYTTDLDANRSGLNGYYMIASLSNIPETLSVVDDTNFIFAYTFSSQQTGGTQTDFSLGENAVYGNVIRSYKSLSNIVFYGENNYSNIFDGHCSNNTFGNSCYRNSFGASCVYNSFGNNCNNNTSGNSFYRNSFGASCVYNSFGNNCYRNSFGNGCQNNSFGNNCRNNSFENSCSNNTFGNFCQYNSLKDYSRYIIFENGNQYITLTSTQTTDSSNVLRNIKICQGVNNTTTIKIISHDTVNDTFQTEYKATNSQTILI